MSAMLLAAINSLRSVGVGLSLADTLWRYTAPADVVISGNTTLTEHINYFRDLTINNGIVLTVLNPSLIIVEGKLTTLGTGRISADALGGRGRTGNGEGGYGGGVKLQAENPAGTMSGTRGSSYKGNGGDGGDSATAGGNAGVAGTAPSLSARDPSIMAIRAAIREIFVDISTGIGYDAASSGGIGGGGGGAGAAGTSSATSNVGGSGGTNGEMGADGNGNRGGGGGGGGWWGGGGGGGGGVDTDAGGSGSGGDGGHGGGVAIMVVRDLENNGSFTAAGAAGTAGAATNGSGGGGGAGGFIGILYELLVGAGLGTYTAAGAAGAAGNGTGAAGAAGSAGLALSAKIRSGS